MGTKTITYSAVESRFEYFYRVNDGGSASRYKEYLLCPTAITPPAGVTGYTYELMLVCTDSASSSINYTFTGTYPGSSILAFTTHTPGAADGEWRDANTFPSGLPEGNVCYLAIDENNIGLGQDFVLYEISGTITFEYPSVENYNITNTASKIRYSATIQETEVVTTPGTNKLSFGSTAPQSLYYGNSPVQEVYLGNTLLYSVGSTTEKNIYGIKINLLGTPVDLANSEYTSVKINGVTLAVDTEKKVGSAQLTVTAVSGSVVAPSNIDIYAWIPGNQADQVRTRAQLSGYLRAASGTIIEATWSWSDVVVVTW